MRHPGQGWVLSGGGVLVKDGKDTGQKVLKVEAEARRSTWGTWVTPGGHPSHTWCQTSGLCSWERMTTYRLGA